MATSVHAAAGKHGCTVADIRHAMAHALVVADIDDDKVLFIGPDQAGNMIEIIERCDLVIHAMRVRRQYLPLLRRGGGRHG